MGDLEYKDHLWQKMASLGEKMDSLESENKDLRERVECLEIMNKWQTGLLSFLAGRMTKDSIEYHRLMLIIAIEVAKGNTDELVEETIEEIKNQKTKNG